MGLSPILLSSYSLGFNSNQQSSRFKSWANCIYSNFIDIHFKFLMQHRLCSAMNRSGLWTLELFEKIYLFRWSVLIHINHHLCHHHLSPSWNNFSNSRDSQLTASSSYQPSLVGPSKVCIQNQLFPHFFLILLFCCSWQFPCLPFKICSFLNLFQLSDQAQNDAKKWNTPYFTI